MRPALVHLTEGKWLVASRIRTYPEALDGVTAEPVLRRVAEATAADARRLAPIRTGRLKASIKVTEVGKWHAIVTADPHNPRAKRDWNKHYAYWVETGTSRMTAQPYLRPATYKYRG